MMKTTKEKADENRHNEIVENLQTLLEKNNDAEKRFITSMEHAKTPGLKRFLQQKAALRSRFVNELTQELRDLNEMPKEGGTLSGTMHRGWIDFKSALSTNKDEAVLEECIRGEKNSLKEYEEKLQTNIYSPKIATVLQQQHDEIYQSLGQVKRLEDLAEDY